MELVVAVLLIIAAVVGFSGFVYVCYQKGFDAGRAYGTRKAVRALDEMTERMGWAPFNTVDTTITRKTAA